MRSCMLMAMALGFSCLDTPAQTDPPPWTGPAPQSPADFRLDTLAKGLNIPMQLDQASDGRIFVITQTGQVILVDDEARTRTTVATLKVYHLNEHGGLGLALDPGFATNGWIYISHTPSRELHKISRFTYSHVNKSLDPASEKVLLQIPMVYAAHNAGGLIFGKDGNLYASTGANNQGGGAPSAWRTSANTYDRRGKILRIRPTPEGGYTVPAGNMFPAQANTHPEFFSMGHRNPFRFSVDPRKSWVYVAEVGDSWEELNQVRTPGNFGYPQYEGSTGGAMANNGTGGAGMVQLPEARPTWITYMVGDHTRSIPKIDAINRGNGASIMAGPVNLFVPEAPRHEGLPSFYHNHVFWWDFNKGMIFHTRLGAAGEAAETRDAFPGLGFQVCRPGLVGDSIIKVSGAGAGIIDLKMDRYGRPLVLEYFNGNLYRIRYVGRHPVSVRRRAPLAVRVRGTGIRTAWRIDGRRD